MRMTVVAILDKGINAFGRPAFVRSKQEAVRSFTDELNRQGENHLKDHPEDYSLYCLGTWDDNTGQFDQGKEPELLAQALQLLK